MIVSSRETTETSRHNALYPQIFSRLAEISPLGVHMTRAEMAEFACKILKEGL